MTHLEILELLSQNLRYEVIEDISHNIDKQSVRGRKQLAAIEELGGERKKNQGKQKGSSTQNCVQVVGRRKNATELIAQLYHESEGTVRARIEVLKAAEDDPKKWGKFLEHMDADDSPFAARDALREARRRENIEAGDDISEDACDDPVVRYGERWLLDGHVLMCGDATSAVDVNKLLAGTTPHLMVTDPPYGVEFDAAWRSTALIRRRKPRSVMNDDRADWRDAYALFPGDVAYVASSARNVTVSIASLEFVGLAQFGKIVCVKSHFVIGRGEYHSQYEELLYHGRAGRERHWNGGRNKSDVWMIHRANDGRDDRTSHGTQKLVEFMLRPIENSSNPGDAVYDPFAGSGTTIIAAEIGKRRCVAMDINPVCCTQAIMRWQKYTEKQAILEATGQTFDEVVSERSDAHSNKLAQPAEVAEIGAP